MKILLWILGILFFVSLSAASALLAYMTQGTESIVVKDKTVMVTSKSSYYLIFTEKEVFKNDDSLWYWKWNSSDVYNSLEVSKSYTVKVYGFRVPFLSWYRNIISVEKI